MLEKMSRHSSRSGSPSRKSDQSRSSSSHRRRRSRSPSDRDYYYQRPRKHSIREKNRNHSHTRSRSQTPPLSSKRRKNLYTPRSPRSRSRSHSSSRYHKSYERRRTHSRSPCSQRKRHVGTRDHPTECRCIGIFGLSVHTTEEKIRQIFSKFGPIERVQIVIDAKTGKSRGFCFVYYENLEDAKAAKEQLCGMEIDDRRIRVDYSITQRAHTPTPGVYMGKAKRHYKEREYHDRYRDEAYKREKMKCKEHRDRSPTPSYYRDKKRRYHSKSRSCSPRERERRYYR